VTTGDYLRGAARRKRRTQPRYLPGEDPKSTVNRFSSAAGTLNGLRNLEFYDESFSVFWTYVIR
jgi:hypothetical protein